MGISPLKFVSLIHRANDDFIARVLENDHCAAASYSFATVRSRLIWGDSLFPKFHFFSGIPLLNHERTVSRDTVTIDHLVPGDNNIRVFFIDLWPEPFEPPHFSRHPTHHSNFLHITLSDGGYGRVPVVPASWANEPMGTSEKRETITITRTILITHSEFYWDIGELMNDLR